MEWTAIQALPEGLERTAAIVEWVQRLFPGDRRPPLVGGAAVELLTAGGHTTGDVDLVGVPEGSVGESLARVGFVQHGRHWVHEKAQVFLEFPSATLDTGEATAEVLVGPHRVLVLRVEDLIADRLAQWMHWRSPGEGVNAYLLARAQQARLDWDRLRERSRALEADPAFERLSVLAKKAGSGRIRSEDLEAWANEVPSQ